MRYDGCAMKLAAVLGLMLFVAPAFAQSTPDDEADAKRLDVILTDAASGARTFRMTAAAASFSAR